MASNRHASVEDTRPGAHLLDPYDLHDTAVRPAHGTHGIAHQHSAFGGSYGTYGSHPDLPPAHPTDIADTADAPAYFGPLATDDEPRTEWNPSEETLLPLRGRHRVARKGGGTIARSRAVLGVGVIAAVGAGGMASANDDGAAAVPGVDAAADQLRAIPVVGDMLPDPGADSAADEAADEAAAEQAREDAGAALRARILQQADQQETAVDTRTAAAALDAAREAAAEEAAATAEAERQAAEEAREREEEERRLRELAASYTLPLSDYRLSSGFGQSGTMWASNHTGQDFAASTGTPVKNIHTGTVQEAAWAGSYGYRVIVELEDGTELWYCHLSSMSVSAGQSLTTGDQIGLVGSTGNSTGPHLHVEVRPDGGDPIDPLTWLRNLGLSV
ncbi:M23 family metallopeptidase [Streptomyces sp. RFCAC02]|uniref:M23 family metallopeptidase n=1 Tax=Streptomyces sp. RFCAC02 TaxID=2499143 RepID=UPI001F0ED1C1|nr:M23 family metallopeptidase [Streptomyces sp. RFCAC02]